MIFPVIHHLNDTLTLEQADLTYLAGADGVFLISHHGKDLELLKLGKKIKEKYPQFKVGINFLSNKILFAAKNAVRFNLDMVWSDNCGVSSEGLTHEGLELSNWLKENPLIQVFASVAFKYQKKEINPGLAAYNAKLAGFIPTTSGAGTGSATSIEKIMSMSKEVDGFLAVASGMTVENIQEFSPYLSNILVATGVSIDDYHFDIKLLKEFISKIK